jgi:hypothetical protein
MVPQPPEAAYQSVLQHLAAAGVATDDQAAPEIYANNSPRKMRAGLTTQCRVK